jgi:hypothetical protein
MSKTTPRKDLMQDIERYTCGEAPGAIELLRAPVIDKWSTEVRHLGKEFKLVVRGQALRHPEFTDGADIVTAAVVWLDRKGRFCRTATRLYTLGYPAGEDVGGGDE